MEAPRPGSGGESAHLSAPAPVCDLFFLSFLFFLFLHREQCPSSSISPCLVLGSLMVRLDLLRLEISFLLKVKTPMGLFAKFPPCWQLKPAMDLQLEIRGGSVWRVSRRSRLLFVTQEVLDLRSATQSKMWANWAAFSRDQTSRPARLDRLISKQFRDAILIPNLDFGCSTTLLMSRAGNFAGNQRGAEAAEGGDVDAADVSSFRTLLSVKLTRECRKIRPPPLLDWLVVVLLRLVLVSDLKKKTTKKTVGFPHSGHCGRGGISQAACPRTSKRGRSVFSGFSLFACADKPERWASLFHRGGREGQTEGVSGEFHAYFLVFLFFFPPCSLMWSMRLKKRFQLSFGGGATAPSLNRVSEPTGMSPSFDVCQ